MKSVLALIGATSAISLTHHRHQVPGVTFLQTQGGDEGNGTPNGWRDPWPLGIDDSRLDDTVMNWMRDPKAPDPPIRYHDRMRQWSTGTWPMNFTWNGPMDHATWNNQIDDGTDDNEVIDL
mgnify:FL=1|tara:strand:- start:201 stop:563 length:363 start_codon:yes stop_codon:yes gene_type:complete